MGLAASQARFLGLTARKSNVEYNIQQINQQRVALSNEVMGLYNEYNNLKVPTPPVVTDYMKTTYTLDSTYEDYRIDNFTKISDGPYAGYYDVALSWDEEVAKAYTYSAKDSVITAKKGNNGYSYLNFQFGLENYTYDENNVENSTITKITGDYEKYQGLSTIMQAQGVSDGTYYMFIKNGVAYYTSENDLDSTAFEEVEGKQQYYGTYSFDYQGSQKKTCNAKAIGALTQEANGRLSSIQIVQSDDLPELVNKTYSISTTQEEDAIAHEEATNNYNYQKQLYEKEIDKINSKTKKLQEEDRTLELKINQLDTEHKAISTEMESVQNVIKDTMEKVFKTFNG